MRCVRAKAPGPSRRSMACRAVGRGVRHTGTARPCEKESRDLRWLDRLDTEAVKENRQNVSYQPGGPARLLPARSGRATATGRWGSAIDRVRLDAKRTTLSANFD